MNTGRYSISCWTVPTIPSLFIVLPVRDAPGIASALILASLGVNSDIIMEDYRLSNDYFNIPSASRYAYNLPARSQEAITTIYSAREDFLNAAKEEIERRYGDVDTYLERGIGLKKEEIKKLQSILLVKDNRVMVSHVVCQTTYET